MKPRVEKARLPWLSDAGASRWARHHENKICVKICLGRGQKTCRKREREGERDTGRESQTRERESDKEREICYSHILLIHQQV